MALRYLEFFGMLQQKFLAHFEIVLTSVPILCTPMALYDTSLPVHLGSNDNKQGHSVATCSNTQTGPPN